VLLVAVAVVMTSVASAAIVAHPVAVVTDEASVAGVTSVTLAAVAVAVLVRHLRRVKERASFKILLS